MGPDFPKGPKHFDSARLSSAPLDNHAPAMDTLDILKRDRFELLSCYLDGEVTAAERKQVENWLATDPETQRLHARLLKLRQGFQSLPIPTSQPAEQMAEQVFARLDRRPKRRLIWGVAGAVAAVVVGALASVLPSSQLLNPQVAEVPVEQSDPEALMLALDRPPIDIPKAPATKSNRQAPQGSGLYAPGQDIR